MRVVRYVDDGSLSVGAGRRDVARLSAGVADALGRLLHGAITGEMTVLAAVEALLRTSTARLAITRHVTDAAARLTLLVATYWKVAKLT
jgi:hypothetical protein